MKYKNNERHIKQHQYFTSEVCQCYSLENTEQTIVCFLKDVENMQNTIDGKKKKKEKENK